MCVWASFIPFGVQAPSSIREYLVPLLIEASLLQITAGWKNMSEENSARSLRLNTFFLLCVCVCVRLEMDPRLSDLPPKGNLHNKLGKSDLLIPCQVSPNEVRKHLR